MCIMCAIFFGRIGGLSTRNLLNFRSRWNIPAAHAAPARHKAARMDGKHSSLEMLRFCCRFVASRGSQQLLIAVAVVKAP